MPRSPVNNPTARILRIMSDYDALESAFDALVLQLAAFGEVPAAAKPPGSAIAEERGYQRGRSRSAEAVASGVTRHRLRQRPAPAETTVSLEPQFDEDEIARRLRNG